jgi:hypothetical protein
MMAMHTSRILIVGISVLIAAITACSSAADTVPEIAPTIDDSAETPEPDVPETPATPIRIGDLSLTWDEKEIGEGIKPAFAIDDNGVAHVAFLTEADHGGLFYAQNRTGDFEVETVVEGYFYGPIDLALDPSGEPLIAYHDHQGLQFDPALGDEVVAQLGESGWSLTTVSDDGHDGWDNSIAVDEAGVWHTAAVDPSQFGSEDGVEYATLVGGTVSVETVGSGPIKYEFGTSVQIEPSGSPAVAYYNDRDQQLEYAALGDSGWTVEVVDGQGDAGRYPSLVFSPGGAPHIAYYVAESRESGTVRHAWDDGSGWEIEDVGRLENISMGMVGARKITSLAFDPEGGLHLAYTDRDHLIYAQKSDDGWLGQEVVEPESRMLGQLVELEIDADGNPHLIWYEAVSVSPSLEGIVRYAVGN